MASPAEIRAKLKARLNEKGKVPEYGRGKSFWKKLNPKEVEERKREWKEDIKKGARKPIDWRKLQQRSK